MILNFTNLTKTYATKDLFINIQGTIEDGDKIGIIGENGAGKTTLVDILTGKKDKDSGEITLLKDKRIGVLEQENALGLDNSIFNELKTVFDDILLMGIKLEDMRKKMESMDKDSSGYKAMLKKYSKLNGDFEQKDGYNLDYKVKKILLGLGFNEYEKSVSSLSGGEKTKVALGKLLLREPDLIILDEPTNHLDLNSLKWLEEYLLQIKSACLIISHDRYFLDKVASKIWEIENHSLNTYKGNYTKYLVLKKERIALQEKEYKRYCEIVEKNTEFIEKNIARASTSKSAKSRIHLLEHLEEVEKPFVPVNRNKMSFEIEKKSGNDVLNLKDLSVYTKADDILLSKDINMDVKRGDKIGIIGENGAGKTSFLKTLVGVIQKRQGEIVFGKNVQVGYYDQEHLTLNPENTVLEELWSRFPKLAELTIRNALSRIGILENNIYKKISALSGGEKAKVLFSMLMLQKPNLLILDEPTNHLDIVSKEVLERALIDYEGTLIFVSHDRYFLNKIPTKICLLESDGVNIYRGAYDDYYEYVKKGETKNEKTHKVNKDSVNTKDKKRASARLRQSISDVEKKITKVEEEIEILELELQKEEVFSDFEIMNKYCSELEIAKQEQLSLYEQWEEFSNKLEEL